MRKFSDINNNETVELSTNKKDFIKNLIEESLIIEDGQIVGKDALAKTLNRIIELNDSKTIIKVLESIKMRSLHQLNLEWINEAIVLEKKKMEKDEEECDCEDEDDCEDCEDDETNESLNEGSDEGKYLTKKQQKLPEGLKKGMIAKMKKAGKTLDDKKDDDCEDDDKKDDKDCKDDDKKGDKKDDKKEDKKDDKSLSDEEKYLTPKQRKLPAGLKAGMIKRMKKAKKTVKEGMEIEIEVTVNGDKFNKSSEAPIQDTELVNDDFEDPIDEMEEDLFVEESVSYMSDVNDLRRIMESINNNLYETHLTDKDDQLNFILSRFTDKKVEKVVVETISNLPAYIKNADIQRTLENLSDKEVEDLYLKVEKIK